MTDEMIKVVKASLPGESDHGAAFSIEVLALDGEERVASEFYDFSELTTSLESLAKSLYDSIKKIQPTKASIEFGIEVGVQSGKLTALLVKGSGKANLKVKLEWQ